jgi:hypothetical protein
VWEIKCKTCSKILDGNKEMKTHECKIVYPDVCHCSATIRPTKEWCADCDKTMVRYKNYNSLPYMIEYSDLVYVMKRLGYIPRGFLVSLAPHPYGSFSLLNITGFEFLPANHKTQPNLIDFRVKKISRKGPDLYINFMCTNSRFPVIVLYNTMSGMSGGVDYIRNEELVDLVDEPDKMVSVNNRLKGIRSAQLIGFLVTTREDLSILDTINGGNM